MQKLQMLRFIHKIRIAMHSRLSSPQDSEGTQQSDNFAWDGKRTDRQKRHKHCPDEGRDEGRESHVRGGVRSNF